MLSKPVSLPFCWSCLTLATSWLQLETQSAACEKGEVLPMHPGGLREGFPAPSRKKSSSGLEKLPLEVQDGACSHIQKGTRRRSCLQAGSKGRELRGRSRSPAPGYLSGLRFSQLSF